MPVSVCAVGVYGRVCVTASSYKAHCVRVCLMYQMKTR